MRSPDATDLCHAAHCGDLERLHALTQQGLDINLGDYDKRTALHLAACEGSLDVVKFVVEGLSAHINVKDRWGGTPLDDAIREGRTDVKHYLNSIGAERGNKFMVRFDAATMLCNAASNADVECLRDAVEGDVDIDSGDYDDRTALHLAACVGNLDVVKFLVDELGADVNVKDRWGNAPLDDAFRYCHELVIDYLEAKGAASKLNGARNLPSLHLLHKTHGDAITVAKQVSFQEHEPKQSKFGRERSVASVPTMGTKPSLFRWAESSQTLTFLDWDDTLFPTSEIFDNWGVPSDCKLWGSLVLSHDQTELLDRWATALKEHLKMMCSRSDRCVIVTNARRPWVSDCIERFAPSLQELFEGDQGLHVVYARESLSRNPRSPTANPVRQADYKVLQEELDDQLTKAKYLAMSREAKQFYSQYPGQTWKNIISVGDSKYEHYAAQELAFRRNGPAHECLRLKAIVTPMNPPLRDLTYRLRLATAYWPLCVAFDGDLDVDMNCGPLQALANAFDVPEFLKFVRALPLSETEEEGVAEDIEEMAMIVHDRLID